MKEQYNELKSKGTFLIDAGKELGKSPHTVRMWLCDNALTSPMPQDKKTLRVLKRLLKKAPKKKVTTR